MIMLLCEVYVFPPKTKSIIISKVDFPIEFDPSSSPNTTFKPL
jgi:hypothetical protein